MADSLERVNIRVPRRGFCGCCAIAFLVDFDLVFFSSEEIEVAEESEFAESPSESESELLSESDSLSEEIGRASCRERVF